MRRAARLALVLALGAASGGAAAADEPAPPAGWEQPPPLPARPPRDPRARPACCADDATCCARQRSLDLARPALVIRVVPLRLADLPELAVLEAGKEAPGIPGAPAVRVVDGRGRPPPWPDGPQLEVRVMPPGRYGEIAWRRHYAEPFFAEPQYRSMGYGITISADRGAHPDGARGEPEGAVTFISIDQGAGDRIAYDLVEGALHGSPEVTATRWEHVEAAPVFDTYVHGYRGKLDGDAAVVFLLPQVTLGFESRDAKSLGGFVPSRFSRSVSFTRYTLPVGPGRSALVTFDVRARAGKRWFPRPAGAEKLPESRSMMLSASQTTAEREPAVRLIIFGGG